MDSLKNLVQRIYHGTRKLPYYAYYLKNGATVWLNPKLKKPIPPLEFRSGCKWHHGSLDEPILLFNEIYIDRFYKPLNAPENATVLDIGANIGALTLFWAQGRPDIRFYAFEPNPASYATLCRNVALNNLSGQVNTYQEAIGGSCGELDLWVNVPTTFATAYGQAPFTGAIKEAVPMITLDDAWERTGRSPIWMLKIDTEGAEGDILDAASDEVLANTQNACIEWHDNIVPGVFERCKARLERAGFDFTLRKHPWDEGIFFARKRN